MAAVPGTRAVSPKRAKKSAGTKAVSPKLAKKAMKTTKAMKSAGTQAVSPKRHSGFDEVKSASLSIYIYPIST